MTKSNLKINYDVISVTSSLLRHRKIITISAILGPSRSKFLATPVEMPDNI